MCGLNMLIILLGVHQVPLQGRHASCADQQAVMPQDVFLPVACTCRASSCCTHRLTSSLFFRLFCHDWRPVVFQSGAKPLKHGLPPHIARLDGLDVGRRSDCLHEHMHTVSTRAMLFCLCHFKLAAVLILWLCPGARQQIRALCAAVAMAKAVATAQNTRPVQALAC